MQLQVQQPNLQSMFGQDSLYNTMYGGQQLDQANANANQNLGQAIQEQQFQAQRQPYVLQQDAANVAHTNAMTDLASAQTPGVAAESGQKQMDLGERQSIPQETRNSAAYKKLAAQMSQDDFQSLTSHIATQMSSPDPQVAAQAQQAWSHLPSVAMEMMKLDKEGNNAARVAGINQQTQFGVNQMNNEAGRYNKGTSSYMLQKALMGRYDEQAGAWRTIAAQEQQAAQDPSISDQERQQHMANAQDAANKAADADQKFYASKQAGPQTGLAAKPDLNKLGVQTVIPPSSLPTPPQGPQANPQPQNNPTAPPVAGKIVMHNGQKYQFKGGDPSDKNNWRPI